MSGPVPSSLVLLSELEECAPGGKVRFLGCVEEYVVKTATLRLKHDFPRFSPPKIANVNVEQVLESIKRAEVDVGTWINVIGYVERREEKGIFVQAVTIWDAGNVNLDAYQQAVQRRKEVG
ncbi:hypothetical protein BU26DRAFT_604252 [Trematosphaeria pertusa]|uniref:CST complex subunit Ten1 n=1 Tax=Trematosphaeria pertusa TaxID=390896 RepID=A0A6A6IIH0_9PLEO|nr:uncharacterized protein BU26DRAFT_604252 [Trematosphaeria pertusa]KAF2249977.1 hypothetical protein BU26DRAFT_604252 [Trematosphaeria pertusa]